jgi:hypothetical protein
MGELIIIGDPDSRRAISSHGMRDHTVSPVFRVRFHIRIIIINAIAIRIMAVIMQSPRDHMRRMRRMPHLTKFVSKSELSDNLSPLATQGLRQGLRLVWPYRRKYTRPRVSNLRVL